MIGNFFSLFRPVANWLADRDQATKIALIAGLDFVLLIGVVQIAYCLRLSALEPIPSIQISKYGLGPILSIVFAAFFGVYQSSTRSHSSNLEVKLLISQVLVALVWTFLLFYLGVHNFARSVILIYFALSLISMVGLRRLAAWFLGNSLEKTSGLRANLKPVIVYGARREGLNLVEALRQGGQYRPVAFLDTDYTVLGRHVSGLRVYSLDDLQHVVARFRPVEAVIAKPQQDRANRRQLFDTFLAYGLKVKTIPNAADIIDGKVSIAELQDIKLEDLLGRDPVPPVVPLLDMVIKGQVVLVTGAGGSIGSELARQVFRYGAKILVLYEVSEFSLFEIHRELEAHKFKYGGPELLPVLGNILDASRMSKIMKDYGVQLVLHAAAYKHVRMVQENICAGVLNNVWGTKNVLDAVVNSNVDRFVLISSDKAVRPTNVMGASKRISEMLVQGYDRSPAREDKSKPIFSIVRFGNVLGSTGSVVPLFKEQIASGGPILVTDPEVSRYFMLISEAAQLVIQASAMASGGEVFVLDMGEPVKIVKLAETMIDLAGQTRKSEANPTGDIEIRFIGLRSGEKLFEELQIGKDVTVTSHPRIMRSLETCPPLERLSAELKKIKFHIDREQDSEVLRLTMKLAQFDV